MYACFALRGALRAGPPRSGRGAMNRAKERFQLRMHIVYRCGRCDQLRCQSFCHASPLCELGLASDGQLSVCTFSSRCYILYACLLSRPIRERKLRLMHCSIYERIGKGMHSEVFKGRKKKSIEYYAIKSVQLSQKRRVHQEVCPQTAGVFQIHV